MHMGSFWLGFGAGIVFICVLAMWLENEGWF
jgi:hypothetical protein